MNKFKMAFALLAVLVILAAPAYAHPVSSGDHAALSPRLDGTRQVVVVGRLETAAEFGETLYVERQT